MQENLGSNNHEISENEEFYNGKGKSKKGSDSGKSIAGKIINGLVIGGLTLTSAVLFFKNKELAKTIVNKDIIIGQRDQQIGTMWRKIGRLASEATRKGSSLGGATLREMKYK